MKSARRAFDDRLASIYDSSIGLQYTSLVLLDIDHFKRINDTFGHPVGDKILATVASVIRANVRKDGFVARSGGEEFAIVLMEMDREQAMAVARRMCGVMSATPIEASPGVMLNGRMAPVNHTVPLEAGLEVWKPIIEKKDAPADADEWAKIKPKKHLLEK